MLFDFRIRNLRESYQIITDRTEQAKIGKYASLYGVAATVRHFQKKGRTGFRNLYEKEYREKVKGS